MQWFDNMKIRYKHILIFGLLLSVMVFFAAFTIVQIVAISEKSNELINSYHARQTLISNIIADAYNLRLSELSMGYVAEDSSFIHVVARIRGASAQSAEAFASNLDKFLAVIESDPNLTENEKQQRIVIINGINAAFDRYMASSTYEESILLGNDLTDKLQELADIVFYATMKSMAKTASGTASAIKIVIILTVALIAFSVFSILLTVRSISRPITMMERAVTKIADGDLSFSIKSNRKDELGSLSNSINSMVLKLLNAEAIKEHDRRTMLLLDSMPFACHLWNRSFKMFECNEENVRLFKLKNKEEVANHFFKFSPKYQPGGRLSSDVAAEFLNKAFAEGGYIGEYMHQTSDGEPLPVEMTLVRIEYGDDYAVAAYARDLREYKKMMNMINDNAAKLEKAMREAEAANNTKSEFLANISHEMRTPLSAVLGLSGLTLEMEDLSEEAAINLEKIYSSGSTLLNIVNDILDISKIEAGKLELFPAEYAVPSLINDVITQNILRIGSKLIEFKLDVSAEIPSVLCGDELRIKQILNNLLSNAFKYTKEGTVELGMRSETDKENGTVWLSAWVRDTGIGIRKEDIAKLFSEYSQVDAKANRSIEGTGLGLAITKKMIDLMDGSIDVKSEYGKGSVFSARLKQKFVTDVPLGETVVNNLKGFRYSNAKRNQNSRLARIKMPYARVLVVDDNPTNLDVAKGLMKPYGMQIDCVTGGRQAIDAILAEDVIYSAIFMDHMMPEMDGIEATRRIREINTGYAKNIPIIALTANAVAGNEEKFFSSGFQGFLSKPIDLHRLDEVLRRFVRSKDTEINIDGIDIEKGLERFENDILAYRDILHSYAVHTRPVLSAIKAVDKDNLADYAIKVHGIKGSSRGIFADRAGDLAEKLEAAARARDFDFVKENTPELIEITEKLIAEIERVLNAADTKNPKKKKDKPDNSLLLKLVAACENYDIDEIDNVMAEIDEYEYETDAGLSAWLRDNILEGNFEEIAKRLGAAQGIYLS